MTKKIMTVLGEISPNILGITLPHDHLLWDFSNWLNNEIKEVWRKEKLSQPITLENRGHVVYNAFYYVDNLKQVDLDIAISEVKKFKISGGQTICDLMPSNLGRDPKALYEIAISTELNIIMGCGMYVASTLTKEERKKTEKQIRKEIISEFENGIGYLKIRPGIIGEVGISDIKDSLEIRNIRASGLAQKEIGCAINIHPPIWEKRGNDILSILKECGTDLNKVVLSHCDPTLEDYEYTDSLARRGAYIEYDHFGMEFMSYEGNFFPSDSSRITAIKEQIKRGHLERILISHDICLKICLTKWGGFGYAHILDNIIQRFIQEGITEEQINTILVENPKRLLSW